MENQTHAENAKRLAKVMLDGNRRLLACLPIEPDPSGVPRLVRRSKDGRRLPFLPSTGGRGWRKTVAGGAW